MSQPETEESRPAQRGAMEELARDPASRRRFLKMVGGGGGAAAFSVFLAACGSSKKKQKATPAPSGTNDLKIVNYALTLEYLEAQFYSDVIASGLFKGKQLALLQKFGNTESQHVVALVAAAQKLGGKPAPKPKAKFPLKDAKSVVQLAATVENLGAAAYLGQAANIQSKEILAAALSIHTVEARHAATLNTLVGKSVTPDGAFGKPASMEEVLPQVKPFIVG